MPRWLFLGILWSAAEGFAPGWFICVRSGVNFLQEPDSEYCRLCRGQETKSQVLCRYSDSQQKWNHQQGTCTDKQEAGRVAAAGGALSGLMLSAVISTWELRSRSPIGYQKSSHFQGRKGSPPPAASFLKLELLSWTFWFLVYTHIQIFMCRNSLFTTVKRK